LFGFVAQWFPSGSHGGTPRTFGMCGLYQRKKSGSEETGVKKPGNMLG